MTVLVAEQVSCEKQDRVLFQNIDLSIKSGELVLLTGENGAGKTSLIRILVGLSAPDTGNVHINGMNVTGDINLAAESLIYIGHKAGVNGLLSAIENLQFWCELRGLNYTKDQIVSVLESLGLAGLEELSVKHLSAGQQRRVALARLWLQSGLQSQQQSDLQSEQHNGANLWILDEPFTALDTSLVAMLEAHIDEFLSNGGAVLMTSHQSINVKHDARVFELEYSW